MKHVIAIAAAVMLALLTALAPLAANADRGHGRGGGHPPQHWQVRPHHQWHHGHWRQGHHHGHLGWWWVVGSMWYFYPRAVYPYPDYGSAAVVINPPAAPSGPPPAQHWYYCESSNAYYPHVSTCPEDWKRVPAIPQ